MSQCRAKRCVCFQVLPKEALPVRRNNNNDEDYYYYYYYYNNKWSIKCTLLTLENPFQ